MKSATTHRVVGVRENGDRVVVSKHASLAVAEMVVKLIQFGSNFKELLIELEEEHPPRQQ